MRKGLTPCRPSFTGRTGPMSLRMSERVTLGLVNYNRADSVQPAERLAPYVRYHLPLLLEVPFSDRYDELPNIKSGQW